MAHPYFQRNGSFSEI